MVRAKFKVTQIAMQPHWDKSKGKKVGTITLQPVTGGSPENEAFYAATPGGSITLSTVNEEALEKFELDGEYYVDFEKAERNTA